MWSYSVYNIFSIFLSFFRSLKFCPSCICILLAHIWIPHRILDRITPFLERFKKFCLTSKYPNRAVCTVAIYKEISDSSSNPSFLYDKPSLLIGVNTEGVRKGFFERLELSALYVVNIVYGWPKALVIWWWIVPMSRWQVPLKNYFRRWVDLDREKN